MGEKLNARLILGGRHAEYPLNYQYEDNFAKVSIRNILKTVNRFIMDINYLVVNYLNIWIVTNNGKQHLFKIRKSNSTINLTQNENGEFQIKIVLEDIEDKQNLLKFFHNNSDQYTRLSNNINKMIEESKQQQKKRGQCLRPIDIAYFFADPLITVTKNGIIPKYEVSYQLQYDKFIDLVKKEEFGNNFRVEMMVANKTNIKNTLFEGASILHFACHGKTNKGNLQIESDTSIGELVDLQHTHFMNLLDIRTGSLPKLIIFNVCYSSVLAKMISSSKRIITIGYNHEAKDIYCQEFTREFYLGIFKNRQPVRELFQQIKDRILAKDPAQGKKLQIFPEVPFPDESSDEFFTSTQTRVNFIKKWTFSQSMRENDSLGVKVQMFTFIKQFLTNESRISYLFLKGEKVSGKSDFMKKTRIYIMNRKVFSEDFTVDLKDVNGGYIETILQLRLQRQDLLNKKMNQLKELGKQRKLNPLIIFDHAQKILKLQYGKFLDYIQNKFIKQLRYGKIVIITNKIIPIIKQEAESFQRVHSHVKASPNVQRMELNNFLERYSSLDIRNSSLKIFDSRACSELKLLKAIKSSKSQRQLTEQCFKQDVPEQSSYESISLQYIQDNLKEFQKDTQQLYECAFIKIQDNDYIFLSTIFMEINLQISQHYTNQTCTKRKASNQIQNLMERFDFFIKGIFKVFKNQEKLFSQMKRKIPIPSLFHLSLKIAAFIYVYKDFNLFEKHMLNCEKLYVLVSGFYNDDIKKNGDFHNTVTLYHLRILLTLYSFYSERQQSIRHKKFPNKDEKAEEGILAKKSQIIIDQIMSQFDQKQHQILVNTLKSLIVINNIAQQLHYNRDYSLFIQNQRYHRQSQFMELSNQQEPDIEQQAGIIDHHHDKILKYWKAFREIEKYKGYIQDFDFILQQKSLTLIEILVIKQIVFNLRKIDEIFERRQSFLSQSITQYINCYIQIMQKIDSDRIFRNKHKNGLFYHQNSESIKPLHQQYLKSFIKTYFGLSRRKQSLSKQYSLPIYFKLIELCEQSHYISGISSIKKQIQLHINKQFFNIWTCTAFIAQPLSYDQGGKSIKCNIKRYQNHVYNFLSKFYEYELDKEVNYQVKLMSYQVLSSQEQAKRNMIQLVICDIRAQSEKVYLQTELGRSQPCPLRMLPLPRAPVVIYFGAKVEIVEQFYNKMDTIVIWISVNNFSEKKSLGQRQKDRKNQKLEQSDVAIQNKKLTIYYSILQYFYCSFCRHFFNGKHSLFVQQVKISFQLAKVEAIIKTKILYSLSKQYATESQIESAINKMDSNLHYLMNSSNGQQLLKKPAYHFIYKQNLKLEKKQSEQPKQLGPRKQSEQKKSRREKKAKKQKVKGQKQKIYQLGCNLQICQLLNFLSEVEKLTKEQKRQVNIVVYYKSEPMMTFYLLTLKMKLVKSQKYKLNPEINSKTYANYRDQMNHLFNQSNLSQLHENYQQNGCLIVPFIDLQNGQFIEELRSMNAVKNSLIRMFFTSKTYSQSSGYKILEINQNYKQMRSQFQHYFLQWKHLRYNFEERKLLQRYKNVINRPSASLQDLKNAIQM